MVPFYNVFMYFIYFLRFMICKGLSKVLKIILSTTVFSMHLQVEKLSLLAIVFWVIIKNRFLVFKRL